MIKRTIIAMVLLAGFTACENTSVKEETTSQERQEKIGLLEQALFNTNNKMFNDSIAGAVIEAYDEFASLYPENPETPDFLFKAGEVSLGLGKSLKSMSYFKKVCDLYPKYERAPYSLFLQAYVLDNHLNDDERAGEVYSEFIKKYPDHPMAKDAEFSIKHLGKSDEELIKEFEKNLKGNS